MSDTPVVLRTFDNALAAHVARTRLEAEGIQAFVFDEHSVTVDPLMAQALGGVKIAVGRDDVAAAEQILSRDVELADWHCPKCDSANLERHRAGRRTALLTVLLLGIPFGRARDKLKCLDCQYTWRD